MRVRLRRLKFMRTFIEEIEGNEKKNQNFKMNTEENYCLKIPGIVNFSTTVFGRFP